MLRYAFSAASARAAITNASHGVRHSWRAPPLGARVAAVLPRSMPLRPTTRAGSRRFAGTTPTNPPPAGAGAGANAVDAASAAAGTPAATPTTTTAAGGGTGLGSDVVPKAEAKPSMWQRIKTEAQHYYDGTRLLVIDVGTAWGLLKRVLYGHGLTRRERKQLIRTTTDLLRLVPFSVFILVPFMELLLPVALRLFPGMLPSTYTSELEQQERLKRNLKARIEMASFLQNTLENMARGAAAGRKGDADGDGEAEAFKVEEILQIIADAREGRFVDASQVLKLAQLFKDQVTLENMPRAQLVQLCKYMGISAFGSDTVLRIQLRMRVRAIKGDDREIMWEGVSNLSLRELQLACQERGMRSAGLSRDGYERQMQEWLQLSTNARVPLVILILSRALLITSETDRIEAIEHVISSMEKEVIQEAVIESGAQAEDPKQERQLRLASIEFQNELIQEEAAEAEERRRREEEAAQAKAAAEQAAQLAAEAAAAARAARAAEKRVLEGSDYVVWSTAAPDPSEGSTPEEDPSVVGGSPSHLGVEAVLMDLTSQEIEAIEALASASPVEPEREKLDEIRGRLGRSDGAFLWTAEDVESPVRQSGPYLIRVTYDDAQAARKARKASRAAAAAASAAASAAAAAHEDADRAARALAESLERARQRQQHEHQDSEERLDLQQQPAAEPVPPAVEVGDKAAQHRPTQQLASALSSMVSKIDEELKEIEGKIGDNMRILDGDRDGVISASELHTVLKTALKSRSDLSDEQARRLIESLDTDGDGRIDLDDISLLKDKLRAMELDDDDLAIDLLEELEDEKEEEELLLARQRVEAAEAQRREKARLRAKLRKQKEDGGGGGEGSKSH